MLCNRQFVLDSYTMFTDCKKTTLIRNKQFFRQESIKNVPDMYYSVQIGDISLQNWLVSLSELIAQCQRNPSCIRFH